MKWWSWLAVLCWFFVAGSGRGESGARYYVYLFSNDDGEMTVDKTHTWATFVEVSGSAIRPVTISWLPRSGIIRPLVLGPERGKNHTLESSFAIAVRNNWGLAQWGPFEIQPGLFAAAEKQKARLESGEFWYRVLDTPNRIFKVLAPATVKTPRAIMCVHAVSDVVLDFDPRGFLLTGLSSGFEGTAKVAWHLAGWFTRVPGNDSYLNPVDAAVEGRMNAVLELGRYPQMRRMSLSAQSISHCKTLEECRARAGLFDFGGLQ